MGSKEWFAEADDHCNGEGIQVQITSPQGRAT
jgi:hypothetical protein